jgi:hypothetical protein
MLTDIEPRTSLYDLLTFIGMGIPQAEGAGVEGEPMLAGYF